MMQKLLELLAPIFFHDKAALSAAQFILERVDHVMTFVETLLFVIHLITMNAPLSIGIFLMSFTLSRQQLAHLLCSLSGSN